MPWLETSLMDQRMQFIVDYQRGLQSVTELADRFAISRKTAYTWIERHEAEGAAGLADRRRRPHACPHETPQAIVDAVLEARRHHPRWGAKKLLRILSRKDPREIGPARTTVCDLLKRHDLIPKTRRRPSLSHPGRPLTPMTEPNGIWTADFKGQFKTRDAPIVIRSPSSMGTVGICSPAKGCAPRRSSWPGRSSAAPSRSTACRASSARTTGCRSPRRRSGACRSSRCGGSASASTRN